MRRSLSSILHIALIALSTWLSANPALAQLDFGDAPQTYPTTLAQNGARHTIRPGFHLGTRIDAELDGQPNVTATGDDTSGIDDGDGVLWPPALAIGRSNLVTVTASAVGRLDAWLDLNRDGDWNDPGERIFTAQPLAAGPNALQISVPAASPTGVTFARFRLSSVGNLLQGDLAPDGEVEDYRVALAPPGAVKQLLNGFAGDPVGGATLNSDGGRMRITKPSAASEAGVTFALGEAPAVAFEFNVVASAPGTMVPKLHPTEELFGNYHFMISGRIGGQTRNLISLSRMTVAQPQSVGGMEGGRSVAEADRTSFSFTSALPPGSPQPWTLRLLGANGSVLATVTTDRLSFSNAELLSWLTVFSSPTTQTAPDVANTINALLIPKDRPPGVGASDLLGLEAPSETVTLNVTLPDGRMVNGVHGIDASFTVAQSLITETGIPAFESAQISTQDGARDFEVSNLGVVDGGYLFSGDSRRCMWPLCGGVFSSARTGSGFKHSVVTDNKDPDDLYRMVLEVGLMDNTDNAARLVGGLMLLSNNAGGNPRANERISEPGPMLTLGLSASEAEGDGQALGVAVLRSSIVGTTAPDQSPQTLRSLGLYRTGKNDAGIILKWERPEYEAFTSTAPASLHGPQAGGGEVAIETITIAHEGVVKGTYRTSLKTLGDGFVEVRAGSQPLTHLQPALPSESDGTLSQSVSFAQPTPFTLPDGTMVTGDEITFTTAGLRVMRHLAKARVEINVPNQGQRDFSHATRMDWGDAPPPYPTRLAQNGPRHLIVPGLRLGQLIDPERNGLPSPNANGDDQRHRDDEDGVILTSSAVKGGVVNINLFARTPPTGAFVDGFVDFNGDGDFADAGEKVFDKKAVVNGVNALSFAVPSTAKEGKTFARIRLSSAGGLSFDGEAKDGEVEDYAVAIQPAALPAHASGLVLVPQGGASARIAADGTAQLSDLGGGAGVAMLANESVVSRRAGRIVTQLQPPVPLVYQHNQTDLEFLLVTGHFRNVEGLSAELEFKALAGPVTLGVADDPFFFDIPSEIASRVHVRAFDDKGHVGSEETETGFLGVLRGSGNIIALGWVTFPSSVWFVLDKPATFRFAGNRTLTGTAFWCLPEVDDEVLVSFQGVTLSCTPSESAEALNLRNLAAKNPAAPQITNARLAPGGTGPTLEFPGVADAFYRVDHVNQLGQGTWTPGTAYHFGRGAPAQLPAPIGTAQRFYRLVVE